MAYKRQSPAPMVEGYTNATAMANTFGTAYFDGLKVNTVNPGTALQILKSNGAGMAPTFQTSSGGSGVSILAFTAQNEVSGVAPIRYLSTSATDSYLGVFGFRNSGSDGQAVNFSISPVSGTLSNMYIYIAQNLSTSNTTYTLVINNVMTAVTVTVTAGTTGSFSDTTHTAAITAGQSIQLFCQQSTTDNVYGSVSIRFG